MADAEATAATFTRLPGTARPYLAVSFLEWFYLRIVCFQPCQRLYLGDHYLLVIEQRSFVEKVRRYYYKDVQAIAVIRDGRQKHFTLALLLILIALSLVVFYGFAAARDTAAAVALVALLAPPLIALGVNMALGPTCSAELHSAVGREKLTSLGRWNTALKAVAQIRTRIDAAQGVLTLDEEPVALLADQNETPVYVRTEHKRPMDVRFHIAFYVFFLVLAAIAAANFLYFQFPQGLMITFVQVIIILAGVTALVKQRRTAVPQSLSIITVVAFVGMVPIFYVNSFSRMMLMNMDNNDLPTLFPSIATVLFMTLFGFLGLLRLFPLLWVRRQVPPGT